MNSIEALDFAIARLNKVRTPRLEVAQQLTEAITTLRALRELIAEQAAPPAIATTDSPYINERCSSCGGRDRVLAEWQHNDQVHTGLCIACRRQIVKDSRASS